MKVGIILPTVPGRQHFDAVLEAYQTTCPENCDFEIEIPPPHDTVGAAWNAGVEALEGAECDYYAFAIDDAEPHPGWAEAAIEAVEAGFLPASRQWFADGTLECTGSMGFGQFLKDAADWTPCRSTGVPFIRAEWWSLIGGFLPIHYHTDDDFCWRACCAGIPTVFRDGYTFTHHHDRAATGHVVAAAVVHRQVFLDHASAMGGVHA